MPAYEPVTGGELLIHRGPAPGMRALHDVVLWTYHKHGVRDGGIYNRRKVRRGRAWSLHSVGRAADAMTPDMGTGVWLANHLINSAEPIGLCEVIFGDQRWTGDRGIHDYTLGGHDDHVHYGLTKQAAYSDASMEELHRWFSAALFPPT